jgi:hypothetical protein
VAVGPKEGQRSPAVWRHSTDTIVALQSKGEAHQGAINSGQVWRLAARGGTPRRHGPRSGDGKPGWWHVEANGDKMSAAVKRMALGGSMDF